MATAVKIFKNINNAKELREMSKDIAKDISVTTDNVASCVVKFALLIETEAKELIQKGSRTGIVYKRRSIRHRASAPGEPPKTDTGRLVASIRPAFYDAFSAEVGSLDNIARYGKYLENGTTGLDKTTGNMIDGMAARPWLKPTLEKNEAQLKGFLDAAIRTGGLAE